MSRDRPAPARFYGDGPLLRWFREHRGEYADDVAHILAETFERLDERRRIPEGSILKRYLSGHLAPHIHAVWESGGEVVQFCVVFRHIKAEKPFFPSDADYCDVKFPVFIPVTKFSEPGERVFMRRVPAAMIGLQLLDDCLGSKGHAFYKTAVSGRHLFINGGIVREYRERGIPGRCAACGNDKLIGQMVESGAKVVDDLSSYNAEAQRYRASCVKLGRALARLIIYCVDDTIGSIRRFVQEGVDFTVEVDDLLVGPLNLRPAACKGMAHG